MTSLRSLLFFVTAGIVSLLMVDPTELPGAAAKLDPEMVSTAKKSTPVTYTVDYSVVVTAPFGTKTLKVWLPLAQSDAGQQVEEGTITTFPLKVKPAIGREKVYGNKFAYFEFTRPEGAQVIRQRYKVKVWELRWNVDVAKVEAVKKWPAGFDPYLKSDRSVVVDARLNKTMKGIATGKGPGRDLSEAIDWLHKNMKYSHSRTTLEASSEFALTNKTGNCSAYHGLCAAFGRALGLPTRVTYGLNTFPKNSPSHCKMEAFLPPYGWVCFDVSETQKVLKAIDSAKDLSEAKKKALTRAALERLRRGFRDNTWIGQTRGTDYDLAPKASRRVSLVRTLYAEADGKPLPEPDPADPAKREFAWMTVIDFKADRKVSYPYKGWESLVPASEKK